MTGSSLTVIPSPIPNQDASDYGCQKACISCLPDEILRMILLHTGETNLSLVSKKWQAWEKDPAFILEKLSLSADYRVRHLASLAFKLEKTASFIREELQRSISSLLSTEQVSFLEAPENLSIHVIAKLSQMEKDQNLLRVWESCSVSQEPVLPLSEDPLSEKAQKIRSWLKENNGILSTVQDLNLSKIGLTRIPEELLLFTKVVNVNLSLNELSHLPDNFGDTWNLLADLNLNFNTITSVPEAFGKKWQKLKYLTINNASTASLPEQFGREWKSLTLLNLMGNDLSQLPETFGEHWTQLGLLRLNHNDLKELPKDFGSTWTELRQIYIQNNDINTLPSGFLSNSKRIFDFQYDRDKIK